MLFKGKGVTGQNGAAVAYYLYVDLWVHRKGVVLWFACVWAIMKNLGNWV